MKKKVLIATVIAMACITIAGCGTHGTLVVESDNDPFGTIDFVDPMGDYTQDFTAEDKQSTIAESMADKFNVELADNQYIITANEKEAIVITAPEGYKFKLQYSYNSAHLVNEDYSESYLIYDSTGTLTMESLSEMKDVEDMGDGCYIQKNDIIKAYCFKDDASVAIVYNNESDNNLDIEKVTDSIKSLVKEFKIYK